MMTQPTRILSWRDWFSELPAAELISAREMGRSSLHSIIPMIRPQVNRTREPKAEADRLIETAVNRWQFASTRIVTVEDETVQVQRPNLPMAVLWQNVGWGVLRRNHPGLKWEIELLKYLATGTIELAERMAAQGDVLVASIFDAEGYGNDMEARAFRDAVLEESFHAIVADGAPGVLVGNYGSRPTASAAFQPVFYRGIIEAAELIYEIEDGAVAHPWLPMPGFVRKFGYGPVTAGDFGGLLWAAGACGGTVLLWGDNRSRSRWSDVSRALDLSTGGSGNGPWRERQGYAGVLTIDGDPVPDPQAPDRGWWG